MIPAALQAQSIDPKVQARIDRILKATPLIDGHNDLPEQLRENYKLSVEGLASGDLSASQLGKWGPGFTEGVDRMRRPTLD